MMAVRGGFFAMVAVLPRDRSGVAFFCGRSDGRQGKLARALTVG